MLRDILQNLNFGHRLVLYRLLVAFFLAGMIYYAFFFPKEGDRAMRRAAEAMSHAKSWKSETVKELPEIRGKMEILQEISCLSNSRVTWHQTQQIANRPAEWTHVTEIMGDSTYSYNSVTDKWSSAQTAGGGQLFVCRTLARGEDFESMPSLWNWTKHALISKGGRRDTATGACQEWITAIPHHNANPDKATVCLGEDDHLPRFVTQYGVETRCFDWNARIDFAPPDGAQPGSF